MFHPEDATTSTIARAKTGRGLVGEFEAHQRQDANRFDWELLTAVCVAKVLELERRLSAEDRRVRSELYSRSGNVIPFLRGRRERRIEAPAPPRGAA